MAKRKTGRKKPTRKAKPARRPASKARAAVKPKRAVKARRAPKARKAARRPARRSASRPVQTPPSSLDMVRRGTAVRSGRAELAHKRQEQGTMSPAITGGDVDVDVENAYFSGDEAPGGDNPTPDQDVVEDIGKALGVTYQDAEELKASEKVIERDKHRWELDPASAEDYKERK